MLQLSTVIVAILCCEMILQYLCTNCDMFVGFFHVFGLMWCIYPFSSPLSSCNYIIAPNASEVSRRIGIRSVCRRTTIYTLMCETCLYVLDQAYLKVGSTVSIHSATVTHVKLKTMTCSFFQTSALPSIMLMDKFKVHGMIVLYMSISFLVSSRRF